MHLEHLGQLLVLARKIIAQGERLIERHEKLLAELERSGVETLKLRQMLDRLEEAQEQLVARREQIEREIDEAINPKRL